jgi:uncharacterized membrane protein
MRISAGERGLAILSYLPLLWLVPLKGKKGSLFVQFHARQGMVLFYLWLAIAFVTLILLFTPLATAGDGVGSNIIFGILAIGTILYVALGLTGIFKVLLGERYRMPLVADVALMLKL